MLARYRKTIVAVVGAVATWAATYYADNPDVQKWVGLALALATVLSVYTVPNDSPAGEPADPSVSERGHSDVVLLIAVAALVLVLLVIADVLP